MSELPWVFMAIGAVVLGWAVLMGMLPVDKAPPPPSPLGSPLWWEDHWRRHEEIWALICSVPTEQDVVLSRWADDGGYCG